VDQSSYTIKDILEAHHAEITRRLDAQDKVADEIRKEVKATNGRVSSLERAVAVLEERTPATAKRDATAGGIGALLAGAGLFLWERLHK
jgi:hypothetical protein